MIVTTTVLPTAPIFPAKSFGVFMGQYMSTPSRHNPIQTVAASMPQAKSSGVQGDPFVVRSTTTTLTGRVASGFGIATSVVRNNAGLIRRALGENFVDGSLNVMLTRPVMLKRESAIQLTFEHEHDTQLHWPGKLNGMDVWLHRWDSAPLHLVEVMSTVHLRTHMGLSDGDKVQITIRDSDIGRVSRVGRLAWSLLWLGRSRYVRAQSSEPVRRWGNRFGATELGASTSVWDLTMALATMATRKLRGVLRSKLRPMRRNGNARSK